MTQDFIFLNVKSLIDHYSNPSAQWADKVRALAGTQLSFFQEQGLLRQGFSPVDTPIDDVILRASNFTEEGLEFIKTGATDKWLAACDKVGSIEAYKDASGLIKRLKAFRSRNAR